MNIASILRNKCPNCTTGSFFISNNPFNLSKFDKMNSKCSHCGEDFERETGFYVGAMYASYALTIAYGVGLFLLLVLLLDYSAVTFLVVFTITLILLLTWLYRTSRLFWINLFVRKRTNDRTAKKS